MKTRSRYERFEPEPEKELPAAAHAPVGVEYEAEKMLKRLKYLETIIMAPGMSKASIAEAQREKAEIFSEVGD